MTREEAINQLKDFIILHRGEHGWDVSTLNALDVAIKALESPPNDNWDVYSRSLWKAAYERGKADADPKWIPVSERLPEENEEYHSFFL